MKRAWKSKKLCYTDARVVLALPQILLWRRDFWRYARDMLHRMFQDVYRFIMWLVIAAISNRHAETSYLAQAFVPSLTHSVHCTVTQCWIAIQLHSSMTTVSLGANWCLSEQCHKRPPGAPTHFRVVFQIDPNLRRWCSSRCVSFGKKHL